MTDEPHGLPTPYYDADGITLYHCDCRTILPHLPKVDLVLTDPPYYRVSKAEWDKQWDTIEEFVAWIEGIVLSIIPILSDSGSFYLFCDEWASAYLQVMLDRYMTFLNHIVWHKINNLPIKNAANLKSFAPMTERILFYANGRDSTGLQTIHSASKCFTPIKDYMRQERAELMAARGFKTLDEFNRFINELTGTASVVSRHYFADSQYTFPTKEIYAKLQTTGFWRRTYEDLRRTYEDLRRTYEDLRRTFNPASGITDVIALPIISSGGNTDHPTTKPLSIISLLIKASSNAGDTILDPMCGSGTTLVAAKQLGRRAIGIEIELAYVKIAVERLKQRELGI